MSKNTGKSAKSTGQGGMKAEVLQLKKHDETGLVRVIEIQKESQQQEVEAVSIQNIYYPPYVFHDLAGLYSQNTYHTDCIDIKAIITAGLGYVIEAVDPKDEDGKENNEEYKKLKDFLERHPDYAGQTVIRTLVNLAIDMEITGNWFLEIVRDRTGEIAEFYHMPCKYILVQFDPSKPAGQRKTIIQDMPPNRPQFMAYGAKIKRNDGHFVSEFIHSKNYNPASRFYGIPPYIGAVRAMGLDIDATTYNSSKFKNNCRPDSVIEVMDEYNKQIFEMSKSFFENNYKGADNAGKSLLLFTGTSRDGKEKIKVTTLDSDVKEASYRNLRLDNRDEVISAHRVPRTLLGISQAGKLGNSEDGELKVFKETVIEPRQQDMEFMLNHFIVKLGLGVTKFKIKLKELKIDDIKSAADFLKAMRETGAWSINEIRKETGKEPIEGMDMPAAGSSPQLPPAGPNADPLSAPVSATLNLNGAQVQAATGIVSAVSAGTIPRDSGKNQLKIFFNLTDEQADMLLGTAGTGTKIEPDAVKEPAGVKEPPKTKEIEKAEDTLNFLQKLRKGLSDIRFGK